MNQTPDELEEIQVRFMRAWEAGEKPTLEEYARRYPGHAAELADFVVAFFELEAIDRAVQGEVAAPDDPALLRVRAALRRDASLAEARKAMGWTPGRLAEQLHLPAMVALWLERGALRDLPARLEMRLAELFCRSRQQVRAMLASAAPYRPAAAHFRAEGTPQAATSQLRTFREAMEECARGGSLTEEQRREWLEETA